MSWLVFITDLAQSAFVYFLCVPSYFISCFPGPICLSSCPLKDVELIFYRPHALHDAKPTLTEGKLSFTYTLLGILFLGINYLEIHASLWFVSRIKWSDCCGYNV